MLTIAPASRQALKSRLTGEETYKQFVYPDSRGNLTIGIGRNASKVGLTLDESLYLLDNDITRCEKELWHYAAAWYSPMDDARKTVIIDMCFNLGIEGLLAFHGMISCIEAEDWSGAAKEMLASAWATEVGKRAVNLAFTMETGSL